MRALAWIALVGAFLPQAPPSAVEILAVQVRLDRAGFSPGEIDGRAGPSTNRAMAGFAKERALPDSEPAAVAAALEREQPVPPTATYRIAEADVQGPFVATIPSDLMQQADLPALSYRNALEGLAEKLHASPALLKKLNPGATFAAGEAITAPNISLAPPEPSPDSVVLRLSKRGSALRVEGPDGRLVFHAPVTTGSQYDPLPIGTWKVTAVLWQPPFHYNPDLFWDADPTHAKATIPPGPNNPVGVVWVDIDKPHYGLHGTPEPSSVGKTASHGCVRMTNWDAARVATLARPGTPVIFEP